MCDERRTLYAPRCQFRCEAGASYVHSYSSALGLTLTHLVPAPAGLVLDAGAALALVSALYLLKKPGAGILRPLSRRSRE